MIDPKRLVSAAMAACMIIPASMFAASHREAPITALDHKADITDFFAFVSYDDPTKVTFLLNVDPLLEPGNGPNYFPFDPNVLYSILIDNNHTALPAVQFQVQFQTEIRVPNLVVGFAGAGNGINAPANAPAPLGPGTPIVPPAITALDGPGSQGLSLRQTYTVTMVKNGVRTVLTNSTGNPLFAVPTNIGPRTMPNYPALAEQGIYSLGNGIRVFAGTVDDPFYIDLGATFDSINYRAAAGGGVLSAAADADDHTNLASDTVSGYNVNTIAIEVPIALLTSTGTVEPATNPAATIGAWATTSRPRITVLRAPLPGESSGSFSQVQRMANPLINELIIGTGMKDFWSMSRPVDDAQFAAFDLDPLLARILNAVFGIDIPAPPRLDLLPLVQYQPPIAAPGTPAGPIADLLRLNTGVPPAPLASRRRLGVLAGDNAGYPNGRRVSDDVTDISLRAVAGILCGATATCKDGTGQTFTGAQVPRLGDGVNTNDMPYQETFPYVAFAQSGRNRRHIDPGEAGCTMNAGAACPIN
ncbi:MAG TPA: DUF4331 domain-containing protein [Bryobacteraceae bacterium]|nr:DUF4331 domain-containing protein [Bryobacteraceae bacterium]